MQAITIDGKNLIQRTLDAGDGFVVKNRDGDFLTRTWLWFPHEKATDAYVHHRAFFPCQDWAFQPTWLIPARYNQEKVTILGDAIELILVQFQQGEVYESQHPGGMALLKILEAPRERQNGVSMKVSIYDPHSHQWRDKEPFLRYLTKPEYIKNLHRIA
jgi:hypothetical protein